MVTKVTESETIESSEMIAGWALAARSTLSSCQRTSQKSWTPPGDYGPRGQNSDAAPGSFFGLWHTFRDGRVVSVRVGRGGGAGRSWLVRTFVS
jgi:hypothetical protein